jgi:hypothetical protein
MKTSSLLTHFTTAIIVTGIFLTIYATVQQAHRSGANDPQLQLARDIDAKISSNKPFDQLLPNDSIDISSSLGNFVTIYNASGAPVLSTGMLDGRLPHLPAGVFDFAENNKEDVFTWQPREGVRIATVLEATSNGFIAVGRSLREVEVREGNLVDMVIIAWIISMGVILFHWIIQTWLWRKATSN